MNTAVSGFPKECVLLRHSLDRMRHVVHASAAQDVSDPMLLQSHLHMIRSWPPEASHTQMSG